MSSLSLRALRVLTERVCRIVHLASSSSYSVDTRRIRERPIARYSECLTRTVIRTAIFLVAALATAGLLFAIVARSDGGNPMVPPRRVDRLDALGVLAFGFAGLIALPGAVLTVFYLRRPYGWIRGLYRVLLFLIVVANVLIFTTEARFFASVFCLDCGLEVWWVQTIVPASLFIALAPPAKAFLARSPAGQTTQQSLHRRSIPLRDGTAKSSSGKPVHGASFPRVTLWLAGVPWLSFLMGALMLASQRGTLGSQLRTVIPVVYVAAFYAPLIVTPVLGYLTIRYLRDMPHAAKVWTLAGLLAGVWCCMNVAEAYRIFR